MNFAHVMDFTTIFALVITLVAAITVFKGIRIAPQQSVWIVEKLGKYDRKLEPGLNIIIPYIESVPYQHSLKEYAMEVQEQTAIARDNVTLLLDGIIYLKVTDPVHASYGVTNPVFAVTQLALGNRQAHHGRDLRGTRPPECQYRHRHQRRGAELGHPVHAL